MRSSEGWLPNLARGVSVWNLVDDLNDEALFDGRLLEPETEGPDNLPTAVLWDVAGLVPLHEARRAHGEAVRRAIMDFHICIERSAPFFEPGQGFDDYRDAFTLPTLHTDGGRHYFFSPETGKLRVMNWGASQRHGAPDATLALRKLSFAVFTGERPPPPPSAPSPTASAPRSATRQPTRDKRSVGIVIGAIAVAGAIATGLWFGLRDAPPRSRPTPSATAQASSAPPPATPPRSAAPSPDPPVPPSASANASALPDLVPERIYFAIGSAALTPDARAAVGRLAAHLRDTRRPALVEGHTDPTGAETENATLSAQRARAVLSTLHEAGVESVLAGVGCAARYPVASDASRAAPTTRRRVEIYLGDSDVRPGCFAIGPAR